MTDYPSPNCDRIEFARPGEIRTFASLRKLRRGCREAGITPQEIAGSRYDFDRNQSWCDSPDEKRVNCNTFPDAWNLFDNLLVSLGREKLMIKNGKKLDGIVYEKLFYGNNLPAIKPDDAPEYVPIWLEPEVRIIRKALIRGLRTFRKALPPQDAQA